jgi:hypothetical protein
MWRSTAGRDVVLLRDVNKYGRKRRGVAERCVYVQQQETWCCWEICIRTAARDLVLLRDVNTYSSKRRGIIERCEHVKQHRRGVVERCVYVQQQETWCYREMWTRTAGRDAIIEALTNFYPSYMEVMRYIFEAKFVVIIHSPGLIFLGILWDVPFQSYLVIRQKFLHIY